MKVFTLPHISPTDNHCLTNRSGYHARCSLCHGPRHTLAAALHILFQQFQKYSEHVHCGLSFHRLTLVPCLYRSTQGGQIPRAAAHPSRLYRDPHHGLSRRTLPSSPETSRLHRGPPEIPDAGQVLRCCRAFRSSAAAWARGRQQTPEQASVAQAQRVGPAPRPLPVPRVFGRGGRYVGLLEARGSVAAQAFLLSYPGQLTSDCVGAAHTMWEDWALS